MHQLRIPRYLTPLLLPPRQMGWLPSFHRRAAAEGSYAHPSARPALPNEQRPCWETLLSSFRQKALLNAKARVRVATLFAIGEYLLIYVISLLKLFCSQRRWS